MKTLPIHIQGLIFAFLGAMALTPDGLLVRLAANEGNDWTVLFWRGSLTALFLFILLGFNERKNFLKNLLPQRPIEFLSISLAALGTIFFVLAINNTSVASALVILSTMPFFAAIFSLVFLKEKVRLHTWFAIIMAIIGICIVFLDGLNETAPMEGKIYALLCAFVTAANVTVFRATPDINVVKVFAWSGLGTAIPAFFIAPVILISASSLIIVSIMGILNSIAFVLIGAGSKRISPPEVTLMFLLETVLGPVWVFFFIGEIPSQNALIGGAIVIATIIIHGILSIKRKED